MKVELSDLATEAVEKIMKETELPAELVIQHCLMLTLIINRFDVPQQKRFSELLRETALQQAIEEAEKQLLN